MADHDHSQHHDPKQREDAARKRLAEDKARREKQMAASREATANAKPTPTQEENDLAAEGVHVLEHEPDGSPEQPPAVDPPPPEGGVTKTRQVEADKSRSGYQTRSDPPKAT